MFESIKNLFKKNLAKEEVKLDDLERWFERETADRIEALKADIKIIFSKVQDERKKLIKHMELLEKDELQNPNVHIKEKQLMEGNRFSYLKRLNMFLDETSLKERRNVQEYCHMFEDSLEKLNKSTAKPYYVLREFFSQHASNIAQSIKSMDSSIKSIKELMEKKDVKLIEETKKEIGLLKGKIKLKEEIEEKTMEQEDHLNSLEKEKEEMESKIKAIKNSEEFKEMNQLEEEYDLLVEEIKKLREPVLQDFSVIEAGMKKYERIALDEAAVSAYLNNPLNALIKDKDFKIIGILNNLKENILKNTIELKDKKREKTLAKIDELDEAYFANFLSKYEELINEESEARRLVESRTVRKILNELGSKLDALKEKTWTIKNTIAELNNEKERVDLEKIHGQIRENIIELTDIDVKIV